MDILVLTLTDDLPDIGLCSISHKIGKQANIWLLPEDNFIHLYNRQSHRTHHMLIPASSFAF